MKADQIWNDVCAIRSRGPLVHNITNYVVMNSTANALLAIGASPVMAHAVEEVEDMVQIAAAVGGSLVINIGTLSERWIAAMEKAMRAARSARVPIVLDPVGVGATRYRTETARALIAAAPPAVIRGNASEIMALAAYDARTKGVDSAHGSEAAREAALKLASASAAVVVVSGATDLILDGAREESCPFGHPLMTKVTGMGCTATALIGAFAAVNQDPFAAAAHAMAVMGICGERAAIRASGPGSMQMHFLDVLHMLDITHLRARVA